MPTPGAAVSLLAQSLAPILQRLLAGVPNDFVDCLGEVVYIMRVQSRHRDAAVLRHIHVCVFPQLKDLLLGQPREAEHADLLCDMLPAPWGAHLFELLPQRLAHSNDPSTHRPEIVLPLCKQFRVVQHERGDARAVRRRVADLRALQDCQLREDARRGVSGVRAGRGDVVEASSALAV